MIKDSPTYRALSNSLFSVLSFGWPILLAIFITPFVVNNLGVNEYGVYLFISTLISLAGLLDIGIASALGKFIAEEHGRNNTEELKKLFQIGNTIFLLIACIGSLAIISNVFIGEYFFGPKITKYVQYFPSFFAAGAMFFLNSIMSLYSIIPSALQRVDAGVKVGISFFTTQQIVIVACIIFHTGINGIFIALTLLYIVFYFLYRNMATNLLPAELKKSLSDYGWNKEDVVKYYSFGIRVFVNNIANSSLTYLDKILLPIFVGPSSLTYYGIAGSVANKTPAVSGTFANVIFPMTASFEGSGDRDRIKTLYIRSMRLITILSASVSVTIIAFPYKMLQYWISEDIAIHATHTLIILTWTNFFLALTGPLTNFLVGMGRLRALTWTSIIAATLNVVFLFLLLPTAGLSGAAWAYLLALIPYVFLFVWTEGTLLELRGRISFYISFVLKMFVTGTIVFLFDTYIIAIHIQNLAGVLIGSATSIVLFLVVHATLGFFDKNDIRDLTYFAKSMWENLRTRLRRA